MPIDLQTVRRIGLAEIEAAREQIAGTALRTPLIRLDLGAGSFDTRLKLENLQPTNAYKLRGALNAMALLSDAERALDVWTISAGNAGQAVAYAARATGTPCTVIAFDTAPAAKIERIQAFGARLILAPYDEAWRAPWVQRRCSCAGTLRSSTARSTPRTWCMRPTSA